VCMFVDAAWGPSQSVVGQRASTQAWGATGVWAVPTSNQGAAARNQPDKSIRN